MPSLIKKNILYQGCVWFFISKYKRNKLPTTTIPQSRFLRSTIRFFSDSLIPGIVSLKVSSTCFKNASSWIISSTFSKVFNSCSSGSKLWIYFSYKCLQFTLFWRLCNYIINKYKKKIQVIMSTEGISVIFWSW